MNCVLKYPGVKWGIASWVIGFFPPHHLKKHSGPVLISGYPSAMYDTELSGWHREVYSRTIKFSCHDAMIKVFGHNNASPSKI